MRRFGRASTQRDGIGCSTKSRRICTQSATTAERVLGLRAVQHRSGSGIADNYKLGCNREDRHISTSNPLIGEPRDFINEDVEFRQFSCPGCGTLIENEVAVASEPVLEDIRLACDDSATETP